MTPPAVLVNATTTDSTLKAEIKSVYTTPIWVTTDNMAATVVKDGAVKTADLCAGALASACTAAGISPIAESATAGRMQRPAASRYGCPR